MTFRTKATPIGRARQLSAAGLARLGICSTQWDQRRALNNLNCRVFAARLIFPLVLLLLLSRFSPAQIVVPSQYFGMHYVKSQPWPTIPFGSLRLWDTDTRWQQMNPASGVYDFSILDDYLAMTHAHGLSDVMLVLGGTPIWISSDPSNTVCDNATTGAGSCAPPLDLNFDGTGTNQAWRNFVYELTSHIGSLRLDAYARVTAYEVWNEFSRKTESWIGSQAQMTRMAQDAYCILKGSGTIAATGETCSAQSFRVAAVGIAAQALVVSPSAQASNADLYTLAEYFTNPGAAQAAQVVATHNYTYGTGCCASAEALATQWRAIRSTLTGAAARLPVWSTEGSWGDTATKNPTPTCSQHMLRGRTCWGGRSDIGVCTGTRGAIRGAACGVRVD